MQMGQKLSHAHMGILYGHALMGHPIHSQAIVAMHTGQNIKQIWHNALLKALQPV